jgi:predicted HTH transcriptional regulator
MSRAEDLFNRLRDRGCGALDEMIDERELESLFLDFKRSPSDGASKSLAQDDNKNLSKAVSGFSNSSGGVVVWGVDCRRDSSTGNEVAKKHPLVDAGGFKTKIENAISRATVPPHPSVQVIHFDEPDKPPSGYVAVLIPRSIIGPLRSVENEKGVAS